MDSRWARHRLTLFCCTCVRRLFPTHCCNCVVQISPCCKMWPAVKDWDGINDRFAVVPRKYAKPYFRRWPWLVNGSLLPMMRRAAGTTLDSDFFRGPEWSLLAALHWYRVPVRRFGSTGAVLCMGGRRAKYGRCTRPRFPGGFSYKYSGEVSEASATSLSLWTVAL